MPAVELRLLGTPEVRVAGTCIPVTNRKALALLAYLAAQPGPHPREHLAALLWPDSVPEVARAALRNALVHLHHLGPLDERLHATRTTVELHCLEGDRVDIHTLTQGDPAAFRGEFLAGWAFDDLEAFSAWQIGAGTGAASRRLWGRLKRGAGERLPGRFSPARPVAARCPTSGRLSPLRGPQLTAASDPGDSACAAERGAVKSRERVLGT